MRWWWNKSSRRLTGEISRRFFRETNHDPAQAILVAGAARSGTTWLAEIISGQLACRLMFEPFNGQMVGRFSRQFPDFLYRRPEEADPELAAYADLVFSGRIRHPWIDREVNRLVSDQRLIKAVRANFMLAWLHVRFPDVPLVFIVRHPCATVLSYLEAGWRPEDDIAAFRAQPALVEDFLAEKEELLQHLETIEEQLAAVWALQQLVPRRQFAGKGVHVLFYEDLLARPEVEIPRLFETLGRPFGQDIYDRLGRPSRMTARGSAVLTGENPLTRWQQRLSPDQVERILAVVAAFDLGDLYGEAAVPQGRF